MEIPIKKISRRIGCQLRSASFFHKHCNNNFWFIKRSKSSEPTMRLFVFCKLGAASLPRGFYIQEFKRTSASVENSIPKAQTHYLYIMRGDEVFVNNALLLRSYMGNI